MKSIVLAVIAISSALFLCLSCGIGDNIFDPENPNYKPPTLVIDSAALALIDTIETDSFALTVRGNLPECIIRWQFDSMAWSDWTEEGQDSVTIEQSGVSEGSHTLTIQASYDAADSLHFKVTVLTIVRAPTSVVKTNFAPVWKKDILVISVPENSERTVYLSDSCSDKNGDILTFTMDTSTVPTDSLSANGVYFISPGYTDSGSWFAKVSVSDGEETAQVTIQVTIVNVNRPPVALEGFMSTPKDIPVEVTLQATDPEGDNLSWRIVDSTKNGTLSGTLPKVTYTPTINFYGTDTLIFTVSDGKLTSQQTRYVFSTIFRNNAPIVKDTSIVVREDDSLVFKLPVTDPENDNLILTIVGRYDETKSSLTLPGQNVKAADLGITYRPAKDKNGTDWFTYMVSDHENASRTATVTVTITPVADTPIVDLVAPSAGTIKVVPQGATLSYAGSDADNDELSFSVFLGVDSTRLFQNGTQRQTSLQTGYPLAGFGTLFPGKKYYWGVVVIDGSVAELRDTSAIWSFSTKNEAPVWTTLPSTADTSHYRIRWNLESLCMSPGANGLTFSVSGAGAIMEPGTSTLLFQADSQMISITAKDGSIPGDVVSSVVSFRSYSFVPAGMKRIPAKNKSFSMGLTLFEHADMTPHTVLMTYDYYMDTTEVTQGQYQTLTSRNPSYFKSGTDAALRPVEGLTWYDAAYFCNQRSKANGLDTVYSYESIGGTPGNGCSMTGVTTNYAAKGFRLATEAEWEFACRGGTTTHYFWGNSSEPDSIKPYAWYNLNADSPGWTVPHASYEGPQPVATRLPNTFGLYDMTGNITEWCNDWFEPYDGTNKTDPTGPTQGENRVRRGGAWAQENWYNSSGVRLGNYPPNSRFADIGFRCVFRP